MSDTSNIDYRKLKSALVEVEPVEQGRSLVVVIGINDYVHCNKLKNAVQDAITLQKTMEIVCSMPKYSDPSFWAAFLSGGGYI